MVFAAINRFSAAFVAISILASTFSFVTIKAEGSAGSTWAKTLPQEQGQPTESECRPYIEKAIKELTGTEDGAEDSKESDGANCTEKNSATAVDVDASVENVSAQEKDDRSDETTANEPESAENTNSDVAEEEPVAEEETGAEAQTSIEVEDDQIVAENDQDNETITNEDDKEDKESNEIIDKETASEENTKDESSKPAEEDTNEIKSTSEEAADTNKELEDEDEQSEEADEPPIKIKKFVPKKKKANIERIVQSKRTIKALREQAKTDEDKKVKESPNDDEENETEDKSGEEEKEDDDNDFETPEEELTKDHVIPKKLRNRDHIVQILQLETEDNEHKEKLKKLTDSTLKELKKIYDGAIKPLETLYKYRDLSNRHFGDPEIFSKPLVLLMGPWSGGKSTIINYLLGNEFAETALRTGAEPSPAYFNILMYGDNETVLDGTQLAADWTFSGLQKFGQGLLDRLKGLQIPHPLLQKVNIVEIPGILEIRKQVERVFPFNDACQWFIDRADIIFLVYDPSKLDVGPETEAILDQLKGREYQTRIILNKADQVKAEELMRVQGTLIWNISPLMSSVQPPVMYTTSLWSIPYEKGSPTRLLQAQEISFLKDLRSAIDRRVENKIASARRFAVRVRNHAKMVDCYLTTYYNHKSFFGNRKKVNDDIVEHPQNYHIYEGLSTLTNISRYDLPDPDVYKDFFRLHPIYEFQKLSDTCTYFRGCPINRLDIAIAYDLPELVGKYKKSVENILLNNTVATDKPNQHKQA